MSMVSRLMCVLVAAALSAPALADDAEALLKKLAEISKKTRSYSANMVSSTNMEMAGTSVKTNITGSMKMMRKGERVYQRTEMQGTNVMNFGGQENKTDMKSLSVSDGEFTYSESDSMGAKHVVKTKLENPDQQFDMMSKEFNLKVLPDTKIEGNDCYVVEATPKKPNPTPGTPTRMVTCYCKQTALALKTTGYDASGKEIMTVTLSDVKMDIDLSPDLFNYTPPPGVQVMDMTSGTPAIPNP